MSHTRDLMQARMERRTGLEQLRRQTFDRETRGESRAVRLPLADITVDGRVQVRVAGLDADTVAAYATVFGEGGEFPPVVVFRDERDGALYLADGFHRVAAARQAGLTEIAAEVRPGGLAGAIEYAEEANLTHGLNLTVRDKRAIFERRLARGHEWATWSNRALAAVLGVSEGTIRNWRTELEKTTAQFCAVAPQKRVGADGREYDVRNIQAAAKQRAQSKLTPRYVDDPDFDQRVAEDDEAPASVPQPSPRPLLPTADRIQQAVLSALAESGGPLTLSDLLAALRQAGLDADSSLGVAALRVALNRLLETGRVMRDGQWYLLAPQDETAEPEATAALGLAAGAMEALAAALDNVLGLPVSDQAVLGDPAVKQALLRLWDMFPPLREKLTQTEERIETLLRQAVDGIMGGLA